MIENITEIVNIIDFETSSYDFGNLKCTYESMISNFKTYLIKELNIIIDICFDDDFKKAETIEQLEEVLLKEDYKIKIK